MRRALAGLCGALTVWLCLGWTAAVAATVSAVQSGTAVSNGNGTLSVSLPQTVNPATSVLFFSTRHASGVPGDSAVRGRLAGAGTVEFVRVTNNNAPVEISWYVVEFAAGVQVQRGEVAQTNNALDVPLAQPVASIQQAFLLYSKTPQASDTDWNSIDPIGGYVRTNSSVRFRTNTASSHVIDYQVVEFTDPNDILVQSGEATVGNRDTTVDVNLPQMVDPANTFVLAGHLINNGGANIERRLLRTEVVDGNTIRFTREAGGNDIDRVVWQAIELKDGSRVMQGTESLGLFNTSSTVSLPSTVDTTRSIAFSGMQSYGGQSMGSAGYELFGNIPGVSSFTFGLSSDQLQIDRDTRFGPASVGWFVVEFNQAPPTPVLDAPMDGASWSGTPGEVTDQAAGNNGTAVNGAVTQGASPAIPGNPGTCRYGDFDGNDDYVQFADAPALDLDSELTVAIWIYARTIPGAGLKTIVSKDTNYEFHLDSSGRIYWRWNDSSGTPHAITSSATVGANAWHHVAITYRSGSQVIYLDGVPVGTASETGNLIDNTLPLQVGQDQGVAGRYWDGHLDELKIFGLALSASQVQTVMNQTHPCGLQPVADWHFDEYGWNGTAGEVVDYSGNGHDGTAVNTVTDMGLVCRAANLGVNGISDYLRLDGAAFDGLNDLTLAVWYRGTQSGAMTILSAASASEAHELSEYFRRMNRFDPWVKGSQGADSPLSASIGDGNWHFLAWTRSGSQSCLYVDNALQGCRNRSAGALSVAAGGVVVGQDQDTLGGGFDADQDVEGDLDEMLLFDRPLSATELASIRANHLAGLNWDGTPRSCPISGPAGFVISHDGAGINCLDEPVAVTAVDAGGSVVTGYAGQITLDTGTGKGTWSSTGNGTLVDATPNDGMATYVFDPADGGTATFALSYPEGPQVVNVNVYQTDDPTIHDDDSEGVLTFAPSGFTLTAGALSNPPPSPIADPIGTQTAGVDFPVHLTAYGVTADDPQCGVIESYTGTHQLAFSNSYVNPGSGTLLPTVDGQPASGALQAVSFSAGQGQVAVKYKDAGAIQLTAQDSTSFPNTLTGGTNAFVVQPAALVVSRVESAGGVPNPGATTATGTAFVSAGEAFDVDIEARDADGDLTPNFGQESPAEGVRVALSSIDVPAAGGVGNLLNASTFSPSGVPGRFTSSSIAFDDVGVIRLMPELADGDYLGTGPLPGTASPPVGRFHPASFSLASASVAPGCGSFTYMGQPALSLQYRLQALNTLGNVTRNYDAALLADPAAVAAVIHVAEASDDGVDLGPRLSAVGGAWVAGEVVVNRPDLVFGRAATPDGPYDPLQLGVAVNDALDGVPLAGLDLNPATSGDCVAAANCTAHTLGGTTRVVYGRLEVLPVSGPENEDLKLPLAAQEFTGSAFEQNPADACSAYTAGALTLAGYSGNLAAGETSVIAPSGTAILSAGGADPANPPELSAPGFGNDGSVNVTLDVDAWLEFDWLGAGPTDPTATASFGHFRGHDRIIYWGEPR